ncbi:MAG TPA: ABC transporter substrate-binding protein [Geobacteraceae bacterium]|nr:ABC transporter substrate-binding protein [Geobacteraceae bacterium]
MKKLVALLVMTAVVSVSAVSFAAAPADTLAAVKQKGVLVGGVKDSTPPFGYVDEKTRQLTGYDIDFLAAIAKKLGVKLELKPVVSSTRMPMLQEGNIDIIAATMTKNAERAKVIDFSHMYFMTYQRFLIKKGTVKSLKDLEGKKIGTAKGSTSEQNVKKAIPSATVLSFDDYPQAFLALQQGKVQAVTTDDHILLGLKSKAPNKDQFEVTELQIADEPYGLGMRKGDTNFVNFVNKTILEMEKNGEAAKIFDKWFGPKSNFHQKRNFKITADK